MRLLESLGALRLNATPGKPLISTSRDGAITSLPAPSGTGGESSLPMSRQPRFRISSSILQLAHHDASLAERQPPFCAVIAAGIVRTLGAGLCLLLSQSPEMWRSSTNASLVDDPLLGARAIGKETRDGRKSFHDNDEKPLFSVFPPLVVDIPGAF